ncbi:MAG: HAMP domain-containing protein [Bryobacterales bacterium]|nr:HAMP domain-containing protein [Bryobacterales bacterium]
MNPPVATRWWQRLGLRRPFGLRLRLTVLYLSFFIVVMLARGWLFRQTVRTIMDGDAGTILEEQYTAALSYLEPTGPAGELAWRANAFQGDTMPLVQSLRRVILITNPGGERLLEMSEAFRRLGLTPKELQSRLATGTPTSFVQRSSDGDMYLVRAGRREDGAIVALGRSLEATERVVDEFTRTYLVSLPVVILGVGMAGWLLAARALRPLQDVSRAARSMTGDTLGLRLQRRGTNDELDQLIDSFNFMVDRLQHSFTQIRQFSIDASHELRTPLTAVRAQLEVALLTAQTPEQYRDALVTAIEDTDHLTQVVKSLLHLSQAESGQVVLAREPLRLDELAARVTEQFHVPAEAGELRLNQSMQQAVVRGDRTQLQRLISNLLANAIKYTPPGGQVTVEVQTIPVDGVVLAVSDTGVGIAPEHLPKIFERFYRVQESGAASPRGLGLGLSFVSWIAKAHGAEVNVESTVGQGTRFLVRFPAVPAAVSPPAAAVPR